jgi:hypothetical protein
MYIGFLFLANAMHKPGVKVPLRVGRAVRANLMHLLYAFISKDQMLFERIRFRSIACSAQYAQIVDACWPAFRNRNDVIEFDLVVRYIRSADLANVAISSDDLEHYRSGDVSPVLSGLAGFREAALMKEDRAYVTENTASNIFWRELRNVSV